MKGSDFKTYLQNIIFSSRDFLEFTREYELPPTVNGVLVYCEEEGKCGFQVARQFERPTDFLQAYLDIIRVEYDPQPLGTFQLNSNLEFLFGGIPQDEFILGYLSLFSKDSQDFRSFWHDSVLPYLVECGYEKTKIKALYAVVTTGENRHSSDLISEIQDVLGGGFTIDEVVKSFSEAVSTESELSIKNNSTVFSGFCCDPALGNKLRLSMWLFIEDEERTH